MLDGLAWLIGAVNFIASRSIFDLTPARNAGAACRLTEISPSLRRACRAWLHFSGLAMRLMRASAAPVVKSCRAPIDILSCICLGARRNRRRQ